MTLRGDQLKSIPPDQQEEYLWRTSYRDLLEKHLGVTEPELIDLFNGLTADATASIEGTQALTAISYCGLPGLQATALADYNDDAEPYIYHFPDGNAAIARLLVRKLIPAVAPGTTMDDVVMARFDYSMLDDKQSAVRLRLNSTVVHAAHGKDGKRDIVNAVYVKGGQAFRVRGRACVMAGYNAMIPHICPELPKRQAEALSLSIKAPIVYTTVLLNNWRAWKNLGVAFVSSPGAYYAVTMLDFPVSMGGYEFSANPDQPIIAHMERFAIGNDRNANHRQQHLNGRRELYATSFEVIERETRSQLAGALAGGGFDPAEDIAGITVNRWGHGYAYGINALFDRGYDRNTAPHVVGRKRFGRIVIANSDAGGSATINAAIDQAHLAIEELEAA